MKKLLLFLSCLTLVLISSNKSFANKESKLKTEEIFEMDGKRIEVKDGEYLLKGYMDSNGEFHEFTADTKLSELGDVKLITQDFIVIDLDKGHVLANSSVSTLESSGSAVWSPSNPLNKFKQISEYVKSLNVSKLQEILTFLLLVVVNVLPAFAVYYFILWFTLILLRSNRFVQVFCEKVFDIYKWFSFGVVSIDQIDMRVGILSVVFGMMAFLVYQRGRVVDIVNWFMEIPLSLGL